MNTTYFRFLTALTIAASLRQSAFADDTPNASNDTVARSGIPPRISSVNVSEPLTPGANSPPRGVPRPGLLTGGVTLMAVGAGLWTFDGFVLANAVRSCNTSPGPGLFSGLASDLGCTFGLIMGIPIAISATGHLAAGAAMTALSFEQPIKRGHNPAAPTGHSAPEFGLRLMPTGIVVRGTF